MYLACDAGVSESLTSVCRTALAPLQRLGSNCVLFFVFSDCGGVLKWLLRTVTWGEPKSQSNLMYFWDTTVLGDWFGLAKAPARIVYVLVELLMWVGICGLLYRKGVFWKI